MIHIGTTNPGKVREIASLLAPLGIDVGTLSLDIPEPWDTIAQNAAEKARAYAAHTGGVVLAEDSGLFVSALGDLPGPWSARYCDVDPVTRKETPTSRNRAETDRLNNEKVLRDLTGVPIERRAAQFRICLVVRDPAHELFRVETSYSGWIADAPRGDNGFGYDAIFIGADTFGKTLAEIDAHRKNLRSHRKMAMDALYTWASQHLDVLT